MDGIVFFATNDLNLISDFYTQKLGCELWLDQGDCRIFNHGSMKIGFCDRERLDISGMICFVFDTRIKVDNMYEKLRDVVTSEPTVNPKYNIYHFFASDPEGRTLEFQVFES